MRLDSPQPRLPAARRAVSASLRPLGIHEYAFVSQSCINRLDVRRVRLTAAKQAAFGIIECVRRYGAAFFTRARSDGVFSRAIRGEEASPGGVALLLRCASKRRF